MATEGQVVDAINHILKYHPQWRGHLNDDDYRLLNEILHTQQTDPTHWANRVNSFVPDTLIGALRNQWPTLFKGPEFTDPPPPAPAAGPPPGTGPAGVPGSQPAPGAPAPGAPAPAAPDISGAAADAATRLDSALAKIRNALNAADDELADAVLRAKATSEAGKAKLQELQQSIIDEVKKLGDTLDTPAGQQQLADFLKNKTAQILLVVKNANLDAQSQAAILDGLTHRYDAVAGEGKPPATPATDGTGPGAPPSAAPPAAAGATPSLGGEGAAGGDPALSAMGSDPLLSGLGALAPAMGALGGLPGSLGSMMPMGGGGGGLPLGDLGSGLGAALHDAGLGGRDRDRDKLDDREAADPLKDPATAKPGEATSAKPAGAHGDQPEPAAAGAGAGTTAPAAAPGQAPVAPAATTSVTLPDGTQRVVTSAALAKAGGDVLKGTAIDEAFPASGIKLAPLGSPVTTPVAPGRLEFGDIGEYNDHRVMALGANKVWANGQVVPLEQLQTGPNFLGWRHLTMPAAASPTQPTLTATTAPPP